MTVVLISLNNSVALGVRILKSLLMQNGIDVQLVFLGTAKNNLDLEETWPLLSKILKDLHPNLIGFSVTSLHWNMAKELTLLIKKILPAPIIWGGVHPTIAPEISLRYCDFVCVGEGDVSFIDFVKRFNELDVNRLPIGIWTKNEMGQVTQNGTSEVVKDLDDLPFPYFGQKDQYFIRDRRKNDSSNPNEDFEYYIMASRGCYFNCAYCCSPLLREGLATSKKYRLRSAQSIVSELRAVEAMHPSLRRIVFFDDIFPLEKLWVQKFSREYKKNIAKEFSIFSHPKLINGFSIKILKEAGLKRVTMGIQSGDRNIRNRIYNRPESDDEIILASRTLGDLRIETHFDIIFSEYDTGLSKQRGFDLIQKLKRPLSINVFYLTYFLGTKITEMALRDKIISPCHIMGHPENPTMGLDYSFARHQSSKNDAWYYIYELYGKNGLISICCRLLSKIAKYKISLVLLKSVHSAYKRIRKVVERARQPLPLAQ